VSYRSRAGSRDDSLVSATTSGSDDWRGESSARSARESGASGGVEEPALSPGARGLLGQRAGGGGGGAERLADAGAGARVGSGAAGDSDETFEARRRPAPGGGAAREGTARSRGWGRGAGSAGSAEESARASEAESDAAAESGAGARGAADADGDRFGEGIPFEPFEDGSSEEGGGEEEGSRLASHHPSQGEVEIALDSVLPFPRRCAPSAPPSAVCREDRPRICERNCRARRPARAPTW
jgi:hypothetical protein